MLTKIISELNASNSSNYKLEVLKKYKDDPDFQDLVQMTYNPKFNYGISKNKMLKELKSGQKKQSIYNIKDILIFLKKISNEQLRGLKPFNELKEMLLQTESKTADLVCNVLGHTLGSGINIAQISKIFTDFDFKPKYMRCSVLGKKTLAKIKFPAILQVKMDGTYREIHVGETVTGRTRSGEPFTNKTLFEQMKKFPKGYYFGEITVPGMNRMEANGLVNSDNPPEASEIFTVWDYLTDTEYKTCKTRRYFDRLTELQSIQNKAFNVRVVKTKTVESKEEMFEVVNNWIQSGEEGGVLKSFDLGFKNGTATQQIKIKPYVDCEMRVTGVIPGALGTKREGMVGALEFENDEHTIKGSCSGFSDAILKQISKDPESYIGKIISVEFNDIVKSKNNNYYSLSHPVFIEIRNDKTETDTLDKVIQLRDMSYML